MAFIQRLAAWYTRTVCFLFRGHHYTRSTAGVYLVLRCTCGKTTPGFATSANPPRRRYDGDAARHVITQRNLTSLHKFKVFK